MSHSSASDIRIGTVLRDTYELTSLLGKGGMGSVFLARHLRLPGKQVAVKVLHHDEELSEEQFARFRREAEIASQLGHPNIVEVLDFHTLENGAPYMVMEYLRGESLSHRLRKGRLSAREAFTITRQMGSALQAAHRAGVVHRDLKPANVFLVPTDSEGMVTERVKLLDFGISKLMGSQTLQTQEDVLMGTPRYMSPEQAMGRNKEIDSRTDIFALGSMVYEMLCGDSPFAGGTIAEVVYRVVHEHPESLAVRCPDLPGRAVAAVDKALAKNPKERFADVASFIAELTGTPLQTLASLGPDPTPYPPRGAVPPSNPSLHDDESASDATFVPARQAGASGVAMPAPQAQTPAQEQGPEVDSTLAAFRAAEAAAPSNAAGVSVSRRPTDLEMPAVVPAAQPAAQPVAVSAPQAAAPALPSSPAPVTPSPAVAPPAARPRSGSVAAVALLAVVVALGWWFLRPSPAPVPSTEPVAANPPAAPLPPKVEAPPTPPLVTPPPEEPAAVAQVQPTTPTPAPTTATKPSTPPSTRPDKPEVLSPEASTALEEAARALESGDVPGALRAAQRSLRYQDTEAARLMLGRAYCRQGDLSNVNSVWRKLLPQSRRELRKYCKQYDMNLDP